MSWREIFYGQLVYYMNQTNADLKADKIVYILEEVAYDGHCSSCMELVGIETEVSFMNSDGHGAIWTYDGPLNELMDQVDYA